MSPVLALGLYWAFFSVGDKCDQLFPGALQYDRFRKQLALMFKKEPLVSMLARMSIDAGDIDTHSIRKGAATYC